MEEVNIEILPWLISFPRCGSHWVNCSIEVYANRPKYRRGDASYIPESNTNYLYFHDHDLDLDREHNKVLYLYRNPLNVVFSYAHTEDKLNDDEWIMDIFELYKKHIEKWLNKATLVVKYEDLKKGKDWDKITEFFGLEYDLSKWEDAWSKSTKEKITDMVDYNYMNKTMLTDAYEKKREDFKTKYLERYETIYSNIKDKI